MELLELNSFFTPNLELLIELFALSSFKRPKTLDTSSLEIPIDA